MSRYAPVHYAGRGSRQTVPNLSGVISALSGLSTPTLEIGSSEGVIGINPTQPPAPAHQGLDVEALATIMMQRFVEMQGSTLIPSRHAGRSAGSSPDAVARIRRGRVRPSVERRRFGKSLGGAIGTVAGTIMGGFIGQSQGLGALAGLGGAEIGGAIEALFQ